MTYKFLGNVIIKGRIRLLTGLRIGGTREEYSIGGLDHPVIRGPDGVPYIPGSSLKGKLRSLLEWDLGLISEAESLRDSPDGRTRFGYFAPDPKNVVSRAFGTPASDQRTFGPSRLIVRDAYMDKESRVKYARINYTELKHENRIDRISGRASDPRPMERVPAGVVFDFSMVYSVYEVGDDKGEPDIEFFPYVIKSLALLEDSYLGGSGTRGYGKVKFEDVEIRVRPRSYYEGEEEPPPIEILKKVRISAEKREEIVRKIKEALSQ